MDFEQDLFYEKNKSWEGNSQVTLKGVGSLLDPNNVAYDIEPVLVVDDEEFVNEPTIGKSARISAQKIFKNGFGLQTRIDLQDRFNSRPNILEWIFSCAPCVLSFKVVSGGRF